jgi:nucleotide-binding universal stress UspA family protein
VKLLAILVGAKSAQACLDAAATAARTLGDSSIEALNIVVDPEHIIAPSEEIEFQRLRERREGNVHERAAATHTAFTLWSAHANGPMPSVEWKSIVGTEEDIVCKEASQADVVILVLAREHNLDSGDALHAAVYRSRKPVLLVPCDWRSDGKKTFEHILVALSHSDAARRAIGGAGAMLRGATRVSALRVGTKDDLAMELVAQIQQAGIEPEVHVVPRFGKDLGAQIVAEAKSLGADLIVAGAYRHSEMIEWFMGGTTRHMLAAADLPLLLAH